MHAREAILRELMIVEIPGNSSPASAILDIAVKYREALEEIASADMHPRGYQMIAQDAIG